MHSVDPSNEPNRPHISSSSISFSKSVETKLTGCALFFLARPASNASEFFFRFVAYLVIGLPV